MQELIEFSAEVSQAIAEKTPVVALESTIISHGMPYPENLQCAQMVESILRDQNVTPATIALHDGKIKIGISTDVMEHFSSNQSIIKASKRDISYALAKKLSASTTVAATMFCAHLAEIALFVTGGIGGVHPDISDHFDISSDIIELANTPVAVVCSGAKSILDLPKTLEMLETYSVPIIGYRTSDFPAFYSHSSGLPLLHRMEEPLEIAQLIQLQLQLKLRNGLVIANPIPIEAEIPDSDMAPIIQQAQKQAVHINGQAITPFMLQCISDLTKGQSLKANMELIKSNAQLGGKIALALHSLRHP